MAYNGYFPVSYQPYSGYQNNYQNYQQNIQPNMQQQNMQNMPNNQNMQQQFYQQQQAQTMQIQNGGYMTVRSEEEARNYPVAPGNSVTFFNETQPYCYKKTMGFSPLDRPTFEKYKIVKEEDVLTQQEAQEHVSSNQEVSSSTKDFSSEIEAIRADVENLKEKFSILMDKQTNKQTNKQSGKEETNNDESE